MSRRRAAGAGLRTAATVAAGVVLLAAGCSSGSGDDDAAGSTSGAARPITSTSSTTSTTVALPPRTAATTSTTEAGDAPPVLYHDPDTQAAAWIEDHPRDRRTAVIRRRIASRPQARWFVDADPATIADEVRTYVQPAVRAGQVPVLVSYTIPNRDCGGASSGGAPDLGTWQEWIGGLAQGLGDAHAIVVMEPDALAEQECLSAGEVEAREASMAQAVRTIGAADPEAEIYLDAGHSDWNPPEEQARRLEAAGVHDGAGFATNVSNFNTTDDEIAYGQALLDALGDAQLQQVIDVSRNGNGPAADAEWCDPPGRAIGPAPTFDTGTHRVAALLWIKEPGEADGCAAEPGTFLPAVAYALATG